MKARFPRSQPFLGKMILGKMISGKMITWVIMPLLTTTVLTGCDRFLEKLPIDQLPKLPGNPLPVDPTATPPQTPPQSDDSLAIEDQIWQEINTIRQQNGLSQLKKNTDLAKVARHYSQQMAENDFFSHTGKDGTSAKERIDKAGLAYKVIGENLFKSENVDQPVSIAVNGWMDSPGHRENILRNVFTETGIGVWQQGNEYYITQLFLTP